MRLGTKSLLFGAHQFILHPLFVAMAWRKLYGFPKKLPLWVAFVVHDWGYWGLDNMDDDEGEMHPLVGADIMDRWFGRPWGDFVYLHSRFLAKRHNMEPSRLCYADKYSITLTPWWIYVPAVRATGEIRGYKEDDKHIRDLGEYHDHDPRRTSWGDDIRWFRALQRRMAEYVKGKPAS